MFYAGVGLDLLALRETERNGRRHARGTCDRSSVAERDRRFIAGPVTGSSPVGRVVYVVRHGLSGVGGDGGGAAVVGDDEDVWELRGRHAVRGVFGG